MQTHQLKRFNLVQRSALASLCGWSLLIAIPAAHAQASSQNATAPRTPPAVGTIKSISGNSLTLTTDSGTELQVQLPTDVKVLRVPPDAKDLKTATPIQLSDLQAGDRILLRGKAGEDATSFVASTVVAMKKADIAGKQEKDRQEWQRHGLGGLVSSVDAAQHAVTIKTLTAAGAKEVVVHAGQNTILRRYAPGSVSFDEAKVAPITEIKQGDQLRARGTRSADGNEFTADEIVSGSFRNIAGTVVAVNASAGTLTLNDLAAKKTVELKVTTDSQMRKLPPQMAQGIAMRLKGTSAGPNGGNPPTTTAGQPGGAPPTAAGQSAPVRNGSAGTGGPGRSAGGDMQQMFSRLPVSPLNEFQKGDVVMVVATAGQGDGPSTVITLLGGVEPILQATTQGQAASILSPWSLNQGGGGDTGTP